MVALQDELSQYDAYYVGDTSRKVIYLTFDCGYENGYTEPILDALKKHNAPAAFFVVGNMIESAPEIVRRMAEVNILDATTCEYIINELYKNEDGSGEQLLRDCIKEGGYTKLLAEPSHKKSMTGFYELLNQAEQLGLFGPEKVARLREKLNLPKVGGSENTIEIR